jgi:hypothetical protein
MKIDDFFEFDSKWITSTFQASPVDLPGEFDLKLTKGDYEGINFPIVCKQNYGYKLPDILGTRYVALYLISDRQKIILEKNGLTG